MADYNIPDRTSFLVTIGATATFQLEPGARYAIDLSGAAGGATPSIGYGLGDGSTFTAYADDPAALGSGIEIVAPATGVIRVSLAGGSSPAVVVALARIDR